MSTARSNHAAIDQADQAISQRRNAASLMTLTGMGAITSLTAPEKQLFDHAGSNPERMRQAMLEIQEGRLTDAKRDLQDAQERRRQLSGPAEYRVYSDGSTPRDFAQLINEDERSATLRITQLDSALSRTKAWQPTRYEDFATSQSVVSSESTVKPPAAQTSDINAALLADNPAPKPSVTVYADGTPAVVQPARVPGDVSEASIADRDKADKEIKQALQQWSAAMLQNNPRAEAAEYAPHMDRYFLRKNVNQAFVEADKADYLRRGNVTAGFALRNVAIENETATTAAVRLVKDVSWRRGGEGETHRLIRSLLHFQRFSDGWKITGEQDFR